MIEVRRAEPSDAKAVKRIYECQNAYTSTLQLPFPSLDTWEKRFQNTPDHVYRYVALVDGDVVGELGFELGTSPRRRYIRYGGKRRCPRFGCGQCFTEDGY